MYNLGINCKRLTQHKNSFLATLATLSKTFQICESKTTRILCGKKLSWNGWRYFIQFESQQSIEAERVRFHLVKFIGKICFQNLKSKLVWWDLLSDLQIKTWLVNSFCRIPNCFHIGWLLSKATKFNYRFENLSSNFKILNTHFFLRLNEVFSFYISNKGIVLKFKVEIQIKYFLFHKVINKKIFFTFHLISCPKRCPTFGNHLKTKLD